MGLWEALKDFILAVLQQLYGWTGDYGWAIVLLTVAMRVVILPLALRQTKSMYELQRIQPKIKELQAKYKNDKQRLQEETLKFYQDNKVNPLGGCLPLLLQMPVFFALFAVLQEVAKSGKLGGASVVPSFEIGPLTVLPDLALAPKAAVADLGWLSASPYLVFVVLFGLSVWLPQQLMPGEAQQKRIGMYMAVMMLYFGWITPSGVLLYWVTSSILQLAQQQLTLKFVARPEGATLKDRQGKDAK